MISRCARRNILAANTRPDPFLTEIGQQYASHRFLAGAVQGCYQRQVQLLAYTFAARGMAPRAVRVLDWGAGKGHVSYLLKQQGFDVVSCDVQSSDADSAFSQETPILRKSALRVVPLEHPWQLPFAGGEFDLVVSFGVLEHVPYERESLGEIHRVLKSGGFFFFCFLPHWLSWTQRLARLLGDRYHPRLYDRRGVDGLMTASGLKLVDVWHGQLLPKNALPYSDALERLDRLLTEHTPLRFFATNLEGLAQRP